MSAAPSSSRRSSRAADPATIAITMGDPAGIGPEVVVRACAELAGGGLTGLVVFGDPEYLDRLAGKLGVDLTAPVVACGEVEPGLVLGRPRPSDALLALASLEQAASRAAAGTVAGLVTAPVSKRGIAAHEPRFRGHTEYLAERAGIRDPLMLFAGIRPAVALLTTHLPLASALAAVRRPLIVSALTRLSRGWSRWFGALPRIGVAGLNPHAGEGGLLGTEEQREILPAIAAARADGIIVDGPFPADSIFRHPDLDVVLALYHDQGTIIAKRAPTPSVNVTLGLPYPRTSPDHGVAYDIAARRQADPGAMVAAVRLAATMSAAIDTGSGDGSATDPENAAELRR